MGQNPAQLCEIKPRSRPNNLRRLRMWPNNVEKGPKQAGRWPNKMKTGPEVSSKSCKWPIIRPNHAKIGP